MSAFDSWLGKKFFKPQPDDVKMRQSAGRFKICQVCDCFEANEAHLREDNLFLHAEAQDTAGEAWKLLEQLIEVAAEKHSKEFSPGHEMPPELWTQIITLPASISKLTSVKRVYLYGSNLIRLPPEIGALENLEELDIYTSYRLHWIPYEVTRCKKLKRSRASTRALYGNYKYRSMFPKLGGASLKTSFGTNSCSVCGGSCNFDDLHQVWMSLKAGADVFPLLVNACSEACVKRLPPPAAGYVPYPHTGGLDLQQPPRGHIVRGVVIPDED